MISVCKDMGLVRDFMLLPEISRYAVEYGADPKDEEFECNGRQGWLLYSNIGMVKFYLLTGTMGMFHPYILRAHKHQYSEMVQAFFKWFINNVPEQICKLNVAIPKQFKGAINAAEVAGMKHEGVDRLSYLSKDGPCDRMLLGITRREMIK
jgi:hypothetical protein